MSQIVRLDWNAVLQLEPLIVDFVAKKHAGEAIDVRNTIAQAAEAFGITDVNAFADEKFRAAMVEGFAYAFNEQDAAALAKIFADGLKPVTELIVDFAQGDIGGPQLVNSLEVLRKGNTESLQSLLQSANGIPDPIANRMSEALGPYTVSVYCFLATYKIYKKAAEDAALAKERRIEAERLAGEVMTRLKAERAEMTELVNTYLLDRILPFGAGVSAMDKAVAENDDDGFVHANAELWQLFGRESQYSTAEEFNDLMLSDEAFKL